MKKLILILCFLTLKLFAQVDLQFDKRYDECEDKWVAFKKNDDSTYSFGFIYLDEQAGLTLNYEGFFKFNSDKSITVKKSEKTNFKIRLEANNKKVAIIPELIYKDLKIETIPKWLKYYKEDTGTVKRLYRWGYIYNGWNECEKALTFLLSAKEKDPKFDGLNVEIAFSYNCLGMYEKAASILEEEIGLNPSNAYVNKEYIYTQTKNNKIEKAVQQFKNSIKNIKDQKYNAENCFNILQYFFIIKNKENFDIWYKELSNWPSEDKNISKFANEEEKNKNDENEEDKK